MFSRLLKTLVSVLMPLICEPAFPGISLQAFLSLAWFADSQYQKKVDFMSSSVYEDKEALMKKSKVRKKKTNKYIRNFA